MKPEMVKQSFRAQFGFRLRECRKRQQISQAKLGRQLDITQTTISQWEQGKNLPQLDSFTKLLAALDVKPKELLGRRDER
jgi:transcriptional regulator with XRE-family HTH domain